MSRFVTHSRRLLCSALLALALAWVVPAGTALAQGKTLVVVPEADLKIPDVNFTTAFATAMYGYMVYDTLFSLDADYLPAPEMVETYEVSPDNRTYTFTLRPGLKFHDGQPVRAADAVASIRRWTHTSTGRLLDRHMKSLTALDASRFRLELKDNFGMVLDAFARILAVPLFVLPERVAMGDPKQQTTEKIGSGPFLFNEKEWVPGNRVVFDRNPDYVPRDQPASMLAGGKVVNVDRVVWRIIGDPATAQAALQRGEVDMVQTPAPELVQLLKSDPGVTVAPWDPLGRWGLLVPNHLVPPFDEPLARQALLWMVKQETYLLAIAGDPSQYTLCAGYMLCNAPLSNLEGSEPLAKQDLDKARQLMKQSGYDGRPVVLLVASNLAPVKAAGLVTADLLRKIGVNVDVQQMDWGAIVSRRAIKTAPEDGRGGWNLFITTGRAVNMLTPPLMGAVSGNGRDKGWFGWPTDSRIEQYKDAIATSPDLTAKQAAARNLHRAILETVPWVNFGYWQDLAAWRSDLTGVLRSPMPVFWNIKKP